MINVISRGKLAAAVTFRIAARWDRSKKKIGSRLKLIHSQRECVRTVRTPRERPHFSSRLYTVYVLHTHHTFSIPSSPPPPPPRSALLVSIGRLSNNSISTARWMNFWGWNRLCPLCELHFRKNIHREKRSADLKATYILRARLNAAWIYRFWRCVAEIRPRLTIIREKERRKM